MPRAGHRDRSTALIDHRHRKIPPAFASNDLRSIRHNGIRKAANWRGFLEASSLRKQSASIRRPVCWQLIDCKGVNFLLEAMATIRKQRNIHLRLVYHNAQLEADLTRQTH